MSGKRVSMKISGRVQGVAFRWSAREEADRLGLVGWVRNLPDGRVETVVEGDEEFLNKYVEWCRMGPRSARVADVEIQWAPATGEFTDFRIEHGGWNW